jgi:hypothetical protein
MFPNLGGVPYDDLMKSVIEPELADICKCSCESNANASA